MPVEVGCFVATVTKSVAAISTRCGGGTDMTQHTSTTEHGGAGGWLSLEEFCDELGVSPHTAYKWSAAGPASGRFPRFCRLPNGRIRIRREWFDAWIESLGAAR